MRRIIFWLKTVLLVAAVLVVSGVVATRIWPQVVIFDALMPEDPGTRRLMQSVAYGSAPRQRLDVYAPVRVDGPLPILVFIHGGSWDTGTKDGYGFAASAYAARGFVVVVPDYRLHPAHKYPAFLRDCASAVAWARDNAQAIGGDPDRIVLAGHSAGAYNAAMIAYDQRWLEEAGVPREAIRAFAGLAGPYDFLPLTDAATRRTFAHVAEDDLPATQPVNHIDAEDPPAILTQGVADAVVHPTRHTQSLSKALHDVVVEAEVIDYPGIGHAGIVTALARPLRWRAPVLDDTAAFLLDHAGR